MPNFRLNLFLQAKRSFYYRRRPRHLSGKMSAGACWRFDVEPHQQQALECVATRVGDRAIVAYAAPVFHRALELYAHTSRGTVAAHSTFPRAEMLRGHLAWYYRLPGARGVANPNPEEVEGVGLLEFLESVQVERLPDSQGTVSVNLASLSRLIRTALAEDVPDDNPRKAIWSELTRQIDPIIESYEGAGESAQSFMQVAAFATAFNLDWYIVG